jgi:hypothetical protein
MFDWIVKKLKKLPGLNVEFPWSRGELVGHCDDPGHSERDPRYIVNKSGAHRRPLYVDGGNVLKTGRLLRAYLRRNSAARAPDGVRSSSPRPSIR